MVNFLRAEDAGVLRAQLSRRHFLVGGSAIAAFGLLSACGSDDEDEPEATASTDGSGQSAASPTAASEDPTEPSAPISGGAPTAATDEGEATSPPSEATSEPGASGAEGEPRTGGIFAASITSPPPNFDVHQNSSFVVCVPMMPCYSMLVQYDVNDPYTFGPDLAESWEVSDDGLAVTFNLRQGVLFHHGKECTSEDVKASYDRIIFPPEGMTSPRQSVFATVTGIEAPEPYTVVFELNQPTASLVANTGQGWMTIFPQDILDEKGDMTADIVGTGPFKLKEIVEGVSIEFERNPDYFVEDRPYLDGIIFYIIADQNTDTASFLSGQLLFSTSTNIGDAESIQQQMGDQAVVYILSTTSNQVLEMNAEREPWGDERVRQAASLAVSQVDAVEFLNDGAGEIAGIMYPGGFWALPKDELTSIPGYTADSDTKEEERERGRELLAEAGYPDGLDATMLVRQGEQYERTAIFLQDQLGQIGIRAVLDVQETATFYELQENREYDLFGGSYSIAIDDPDGAFGSSWLRESGRNYSNYADDEFEEMFIEQSQTMDPDERRTIVRDMERMALERALKVTLGFRVNVMMVNSKVQNWKRNYSQYITEKHEATWLSE